MTDPAFKITEQVAIIQMGGRRITFRVATGEQGEKGPFTYVHLEGAGRDPVGFCITQESQFENLWKLLEARCRSDI